MSRKRIVFLGSKSIGAFCLKHLLENVVDYDVEVLAVVTKQNASLDAEKTVTLIAENEQIPVYKTVGEIPNCDFIISVQHHEILKQNDIDKAQELAVNLHMAPLPEYRGCNQFSFAIIDDKKEFGTTLHVMTTGIDDGDIIAERRFEISNDIWVEELYEKTVEESEVLFNENIGKVLKGESDLTPQEQLIPERGTSYHFRNEILDLKLIDESWSENKKKKHVRATFKDGLEAALFDSEWRKKIL